MPGYKHKTSNDDDDDEEEEEDDAGFKCEDCVEDDGGV